MFSSHHINAAVYLAAYLPTLGVLDSMSGRLEAAFILGVCVGASLKDTFKR